MTGQCGEGRRRTSSTGHRKAYRVRDRAGLARLVEEEIIARAGGSLRTAVDWMSRLRAGKRSISRTQLARYLKGEVSEVPPGMLQLFLAAIPAQLHEALMACLATPGGENFKTVRRRDRWNLYIRAAAEDLMDPRRSRPLLPDIMAPAFHSKRKA